MFVTVAVINVKNCWQFEAICCISPCVNTVRSIIHTMDMSMSETETKRVDQTTTDVVCVRECVDDACMYACYCLS